MCRATLRQQRQLAQFYMRSRIACHFFTICFLVGGALYASDFHINEYLPLQNPNVPETGSEKQ